MTDTPQGSGWGQASDGDWHPPHLGPDSAAQTQLGPTSAERTVQRQSRGPLVVLVSVFVLIVAGVGLGLYVTTKASAIGLGNGTATITWRHATASINPTSGFSINPPPQPFTGTIEGVGVSGTSIFLVGAGSAPQTSGDSPFSLQRWTGSFDGKRFNLVVSVSIDSTARSASFSVSGTWGIDQVHAVAVPTGPNGDTAHFEGTVGKWKVGGTITQPRESGRTVTVTASFKVTQ
jgi:hypothetical protein